MRVLLVNDGDRGGSIVGMKRLHHGLKIAGVDSKILNRRTFDFPDTIAIPRSRRIVRLESLLRKVTSRLGLNDIHCLSTFSIKNMEAYLKADLLNFHTIQGGFFNYLALPKLTANKPAVFTLCDMWSFTGHCSFSFDCTRWKIGCGQCPYLSITPPVRMDNTRFEWKLKNWVYKHSNLAIATPSKWLTQQVKESMLNHLPIHYIPYGVDLETYQPLDSEQCRRMLGIGAQKKVLMFAAMSMARSHSHTSRKGCDLLLEALNGLPESLKKDCVLLIVGQGGRWLAEAVGIRAVDLGYLSSDRLQAIAYSATDLFLCPTRAETFGLVLLESIACGTPVVSFRIGPIPELVRPGITGYLAEPESARDFRDGIVKLLGDEALHGYMRQQCREIAINEYPLKRQIESYISLYKEVLQKPQVEELPEA